MPTEELYHLLRSFTFLAEDTIYLQRALEISQTYFYCSYSESNQEHLAYRPTHLRFISVDSKTSEFCAKHITCFQCPLVSKISIPWTSRLAHFPGTDLTSFHWNGNFILLTFLRFSSCWWSLQIFVVHLGILLCLSTYMLMCTTMEF